MYKLTVDKLTEGKRSLLLRLQQLHVRPSGAAGTHISPGC